MRRSRVFRIQARVGVVLLAGLVPAAGAVAQQVRPDSARQVRTVRLLVEYVGGANLYIAAGPERGLAAGDTLEVHGASGRTSGRIRVISSVAGRSVAAFAGAPFPVTRGDSLDVRVPVERLALPDRRPGDPAVGDSVAAAGTPGPARSAPPQTSAERPRQAQPRRPTSSGARLDGSLSFDVDALSSRSTDPADGPADPWRFVTPTARLNAMASGLPGGFRANVNGSFAQYYANGSPAPGRSERVRVYQAEIEKTFDRAPVQIRAGRFFERHDVWGGYLDGAALRIGGAGDGPGIGVSGGVAPLGADQSMFTGDQRLAVFADYRYRGSAFGYDMDVAFTRRTWSDAPADRYLGLTQRFRFGSGTVYQRARMDFDPLDGSIDVSQFDLMTSLPLGAGWMVRGQYSRRSFDWVVGSGVTAVQRRDRAGGGLSWSGPAGSVSLDAQVMRRDDRPLAPLYSGSIYLPDLIGGFLGFSLNGSLNQDPLLRSAYVAPGLIVNAGGLRADASWTLYRTETSAYVAESQGTSFSLSFPIRRGLRASISGDLQKNAGSSSQRLYTGIWAAF